MISVGALTNDAPRTNRIKTKMEKEATTISIPATLAKKIEKRCEGTEFKNISSYVTHVLKELLSSLEEQEAVFLDEDRDLVKKRLKSLGYL